jgi:hypothetical protein
MIGGIKEPGIACIGGEPDQRADRYQASIVSGGATLDVVDLVSEFEVLAVDGSLARTAFDDSPAHDVSTPSWLK